MSTSDDIIAYLNSLKPAPGQDVESFAKSGLAWQAEILSANAGGDIAGLEWHEISEEAREGWREWARKKFAETT